MIAKKIILAIVAIIFLAVVVAVCAMILFIHDYEHEK